MSKAIDITSGKGFKYTEEVELYLNSQTKVTIQCKHVPNRKTREFHHLEVRLKKYSKKRNDEVFNKDAFDSICFTTNDKNNQITDNSLKMFMQILEGQREFVFKKLPAHTTLLLEDKQFLEELLIKIQTREETIGLIEKIIDKSELSFAEILKLGNTTKRINEKRIKIRELEELIDKPDVKEVTDIHRKLKEMPWIFGPEYEKIDVKNAGEQIPDARLKRIDGLSDILEVKLPDVELLRRDKYNRHYISPDLSKAIGQLIGYLEYYHSSYSTQIDDNSNEEIEEDFSCRYYKPKGILLIGRRFCKDLTNKTQNTSDASPKQLRRALSYFHWIEILTYDDLIERAKQSINNVSS